MDAAMRTSKRYVLNTQQEQRVPGFVHHVSTRSILMEASIGPHEKHNCSLLTHRHSLSLPTLSLSPLYLFYAKYKNVTSSIRFIFIVNIIQTHQQNIPGKQNTPPPLIWMKWMDEMDISKKIAVLRYVIVFCCILYSRVVVLWWLQLYVVIINSARDVVLKRCVLISFCCCWFCCCVCVCVCVVGFSRKMWITNLHVQKREHIDHDVTRRRSLCNFSPLCGALACIWISRFVSIKKIQHRQWRTLLPSQPVLYALTCVRIMFSKRNSKLSQYQKKSTMAVGRNVFIESAVRAVMQHLSVGSPCRDNFLLVCSSIASSYLNN